MVAAVAAAVLAGPAVAGPYAAAVLADAPYAYWRLDEASGTVAADSSGNGRDGSFVAAPLLGQGGALAEGGNSAVRFSAGSGQYVNIPLGFGGVGWSEVTVEAWVNLLGLTGDFQAIVSATGVQFVHLQAFGAGNNVVYGSPASSYLPIVPTNANSGWHHVVMTSKPGEQRLYLDGALIGSTAVAVNEVGAASSIRIGSGYAGGRFFEGLIDEVAIYRTALSEAQVDAHFAAANATDMPEPGTLALLGGAMAGLAGVRRRGLRFG